MKYVEIMDIFVRFSVLSYSCPPQNPQMEALKKTWVAFAEALKFYTLTNTIESKNNT